MHPWSVKLEGDIKQWIRDVDKRLTPTGAQRINRDIFGRIIHAAVTWNFAVEARNRPRKWPPLSKLHAKIKDNTKNLEKYPMRQPPMLGQYPTPWGNINVRTGRLFNTLGTIFRVTPTSVYYGTTTTYAEAVQKGKVVRRIWVNYETKTGKEVSYYKDLKKPAVVPPRPFNFVGRSEIRAGLVAAGEYIIAGKNRTMVIIPKIAPWGGNIMAPGGRRVYIYGRRG